LRDYTVWRAFCSAPSGEPVLQAASPSLPKATLPAISVDILPEETKIKIGTGQKKAEAASV